MILKFVEVYSMAPVLNPVEALLWSIPRELSRKEPLTRRPEPMGGVAMRMPRGNGSTPVCADRADRRGIWGPCGWIAYRSLFRQ